MIYGCKRDSYPMINRRLSKYNVIYTKVNKNPYLLSVKDPLISLFIKDDEVGIYL